VTTTASARARAECLRVPPSPDTTRARLRTAAGAGQLGYGVLRLRRGSTGSGWYHVVLGARQVVQGRLDAAGAFSAGADAAVDGIHVATMLGAALVWRSRRREALLGAAYALAWALVDRALTRYGTPDGPDGAAGGHPARG